MHYLLPCFTTEKRQSMYNNSVTMTSPYNEDSPSRRELDGSTKNSDLPLFELSTIVAATDNFSIANKLGEGGFGSVYKVVTSKES